MKSWYILSYDIRDPKRLRRFHYRISKQGLALQESVFLLQADRQTLKDLQKTVNECVHRKIDDVRLYPVHHPGAIWGAGKQSKVFEHIYPAARPKSKRGIRALIRKIIHRKPS